MRWLRTKAKFCLNIGSLLILLIIELSWLYIYFKIVNAFYAISSFKVAVSDRISYKTFTDPFYIIIDSSDESVWVIVDSVSDSRFSMMANFV